MSTTKAMKARGPSRILHQQVVAGMLSLQGESSRDETNKTKNKKC